MESIQEDASREPGVITQGFFNSEDGTSIFYEISGRGKPLVFCYGLVCRREHWRHQLKHFQESYTVISFDYRGHHRSEIPRNDTHMSLEWCARDTCQLIKHLNLDGAVVFGHSMGVAVAAHAAMMLPNKVKGIVLICGSVSNPFQSMFYTDRLEGLYRFTQKAYEWAPEAVSFIWQRVTKINRLNFYLTSRLGFNPNLAESEDVTSYLTGVHQTTPKTFFSLLSDYTRVDGREGLKKIKCPALVIAGMDDYITPIHLQEEMGQLIARAIVEKIPMGSHNAHTDLPDMVNQKIENFLKDVGY